MIKRNIRSNNLIRCMIIMALVCSLMLTGCGRSMSEDTDSGSSGNSSGVASEVNGTNDEADDQSSNGKYSSVEDFTGKKIGVVTGTIDEQLCETYIKDPEVVRFNSYPEEYLALATGKVDGAFVSNVGYGELKKQYPHLKYLSQVFDQKSLYFVVSKNDSGRVLEQELKEYLDKIKADGSLEEINDRWYNHTEEQEDIPFDELVPVNGTIRYVETANPEPWFCVGEKGYRGEEAEILKGFATEYGYDIEVYITEFPSLLAGITTGKYDLTSAFAYTEERAEKLLYVDWYVHTCHFLMYFDEGTSVAGEEAEQGLFAGIRESFYNNFIREMRWKLMAEGLLVTIEISVCSAILGTLIGILLCFIRRNKIKALRNGIAGVIRFIQGVPIVVMLLVLYYVVFADSAISGIYVGILGFSIDFGVYVSEIFRAGIESIDRGQWEAAEALGFDRLRLYSKIIIPQALRISLPVYKGQFISMVKMTSVIGYLTVQDLTKASDIIRSRTYDAFFPLIVTAIIYFLLAWGMTALLGRLELNTDPARRKNVLKGINRDIQISESKMEISGGPTGEILVEIEHLRKEFERVTPLMDVNTVVRSGDIISVIGPSGTGKSTLLRCINQLDQPTSGRVRVFGQEINRKNICQLRMEMGMVFQSFNLFEHLTVVENIMLAPTVLKHEDRQTAYERAMSLLDRVGLAEKALAYPAELSGGQKQRIAIVRAVAMNPRLMMFDEPTSALDPTMINEVLRVIRGLAQSGMTMLIVTHEMKFARDVSNRVFYMDEGGIYEDGSSEQIFEKPQRERTRAFINKLSLFNMVLSGPCFDFMRLQSDLMEFGIREMLDRRVLNRIMLCAEEITVQGLKNMGTDCFPAELTVEIDERGFCRLLITYGGDAKNVMENMDELSVKLVYSNSKRVEYSFEDNNRVLIEQEV